MGRAICLHKTSDRFVDAVVAAASALTVGDPADPATEIGPLVSGERLERLVSLVDDAVQQGATLHCGGPVAPDGIKGAFFAPAVLTGVEPRMRLWREEAPGPVLVVHEAGSEEEAIRLANASAFGLGASVWTADRFKGARIARELQTGMVWMNDHLVARSAPQVPWGGVKGSGIGRSRGAVALRTCAEPKVDHLGPPDRQTGVVVPLRRDAGRRGAHGRRTALRARHRSPAGAAAGRRGAGRRDRALAAHAAQRSLTTGPA